MNKQQAHYAQRYYENGATIPYIAKQTGLTIEQVKTIIKQYEQSKY